MITLDPHSQVAITTGGVTLSQGSIQVTGLAEIGMPSSNLFLQPGSPETVFKVGMADREFIVRVIKGRAALVNRSNTTYAHLDTGTTMRFHADDSNRNGMYLSTSGCLETSGGRRFLTDQAIHGKVEVLGITATGILQSLSVQGDLQALPAKTIPIAAQLRVTEQKTLDVNCRKPSDPVGLIGIGAGLAGAGVAIGTTVSDPGKLPGNVSVP